MRPVLFAALAALPLAACGDASEPAPEVSPTQAAPADAAPPSPSAATSPAPGEAPEPAIIPAPVQGRWGLTEADCTSTRGDAKGLLTIGPEKLTFYESVGTLGDIEEAGESRIRAEFSFIGEGTTWTRDIVLDAQDGGESLIRREYGEGAAPDPFRYTRCP